MGFTVCAIVKTWLSQGSQTMSQCDVTKRQRPRRLFAIFASYIVMNVRRHRILKRLRVAMPMHNSLLEFALLIN